MATKPTTDDVLAWVGLDQAPTADVVALYDEATGSAVAYVERLVELPVGDYPEQVRTAILMVASRLARRARSTPEGVLGFGDFGAVRLASSDPDVERLLSPFLIVPGVA